MRFRFHRLCAPLLFAGLALIPAGARAAGTLPCSTFLSTLKSYPASSAFVQVMKNYSSTYTNSATGQTFRYLAVSPTNPGATHTYETLVFFNGTSQITPDWPVGMLYTSSSSLCDNFALVFSDYPGIGDTAQPAATEFTFDNISSNLYNLLKSLNSSQGFNIKSVDPVGWSLGTEASLKFTALATHNSAFAASGMRINKLFLMATKPGGDLQSGGQAAPLTCSDLGAPGPGPLFGTYFNASGGQANCVTSVLNQLYDFNTTAKWTLATAIKKALVSELFPYVNLSGTGQSPYGPNNPAAICAVSLSSTGYQVDSMCNLMNDQAVISACDGADQACLDTQQLFETNRLSLMYLDNISYAQYSAQRSLNFTYDYGNCTGSSSSSWQSTGCTFNGSQTSQPYYNAALVVNGSPCTTTVQGSSAASPVVGGCPQLSAPFGGVYIFNGAEDMFVRYDYGAALCNWLNSSHVAPCTLTTFPNAGHGVQYDYPSQIQGAITSALPLSH